MPVTLPGTGEDVATKTIGGEEFQQVNRAGSATTANVASSASAVTVLASNDDRAAAIFFNDSTEVLRLKYGSGASATSFTYKLGPGDYHREEQYTGIITGIWENANGNARVTELS